MSNLLVISLICNFVIVCERNNSFAVVTKDKICTFVEGIKNDYSNVKKKCLLTAFEEAKKLHEKNKGKINIDNTTKASSSSVIPNPSNINTNNIKKVIPKAPIIKKRKQSDSIDNSNKSKMNQNTKFLNTKRVRENLSNCKEGTLLNKISKYMKYICQSFTEETEVKEKETLLRVFSYFLKYKIESPIETLKVRQD